MSDIPGVERARISKDHFDAALVPGFREATRANYRELTARAAADMSSILDDAGRLLPSVEIQRDCPLCSSASVSATPFIDKLGLHIVSCPQCGLIYSANVLDEQYDLQRYVASAAQSSYQDLKRNESYAAIERVKCAYILQRLGDLHPAKGSLLDIGSGAGRLLDAARDAGWRTLGIDVSPGFAAAGRAAGHEVVEGAFPGALARGQSFDAIVMLDVLEHLHEPLRLVEDAASRLEPGGLLVIQVPNVDSLLIRLEGAASLNFCHGHWNHFSPRSLAALAVRAGLVPRAMETIISEIDRVQSHPPERIRQVARATCGLEPPDRIDATWLHEAGMGYKVLGFFEREGVA